MHELDKILEEIYETIERYGKNPHIDENVTDMCYGLNIAKDIIRKHMNDGWTQVKNRLPTMEEYRENDGRFIFDNGNRRYAGYFDVYTGRFYYYRHITPYRAELYEDNMIIAWRSLPESYRQERTEV